jgi:hypothetical protein
MEPVLKVPDEDIQHSIRMRLGEALRCYYDLMPTLPDRLYELVRQLESNAREGRKHSHE